MINNNSGFDLHNPEGSGSGRGSNSQLPTLMVNNGSNHNFDLHQPERQSEFSSNNFKTPAFFGGGGITKEIMKMQD